MANDLVPVTEIRTMAQAIAASGLFGVKTPDQALALMLIAQAEGRHPAIAARDYDIIQGRPAKKSEAMLRDFLVSGGKVEWHALSDTAADATFSHPQGGTVRITWDMERAKAAGLSGKDNWKKFPRQMLRARIVSEGVRTVCPMATSGMYVPEEVQDFDEPKPVTIDQPKQPVIEQPKPLTDNLTALADSAKAFAVLIESATTIDALEAAVSEYAVLTGTLAVKLPKWHARILELIENHRKSFETVEVVE